MEVRRNRGRDSSVKSIPVAATPAKLIKRREMEVNCIFVSGCVVAFVEKVNL